jgi:uncharacterized protein
MRFEWDEGKRRSNIEKHGIDFADLPLLFEGRTVLLKDDRFNYNEIRFITLGWLSGIVLLVAHTETDEVIRIISARKATSYEEEQYFEEVTNELGAFEEDG